MTKEIKGRQPYESLLQYRGRIRRERSDEVDALGLKDGDPIWWNGKRTRFNPAIMKRSDVKYQNITRLEHKDVEVMEAEEKRREENKERIRIANEKREGFYARPEVMAASSIMYMLQDDLSKYIDKLTPKEWIALAAKLEAR